MKTDPFGTLYIVSTPIGNLADMSVRAIETLSQVDCIACEDTRHSKKLLDYYHINSSTIAYHEHSGVRITDKLLAMLARGRDVALVSDSGTPLISDPGYRLVCRARQDGYEVVPIPGSCALIAAISVSGLASDRFSFVGFLPSKSGQRRETLKDIQQYGHTVICYESPYRIKETLRDAVEILGADRNAFIAREMTKMYETYLAGSLGELVGWVTCDIDQQKGEIVLLIEASNESGQISSEAERILLLMLREFSASKAASLTAKITGLEKRTIYKRALDLSDQ